MPIFHQNWSTNHEKTKLSPSVVRFRTTLGQLFGNDLVINEFWD